MNAYERVRRRWNVYEGLVITSSYTLVVRIRTRTNAYERERARMNAYEREQTRTNANERVRTRAYARVKKIERELYEIVLLLSWLARYRYIAMLW
jgi:hypothetical protein